MEVDVDDEVVSKKKNITAVKRKGRQVLILIHYKKWAAQLYIHVRILNIHIHVHRCSIM